MSKDDSRDVLTQKTVREAFPARDINKLGMVVIDGHTYVEGPDKYWYRLESNDD